MAVSDSAPEVDDFLAAMIGTARATKFLSPSEIVRERLPNLLKAAIDVPLFEVWCRHQHDSSSDGARPGSAVERRRETLSTGCEGRFLMLQTPIDDAQDVLQHVEGFCSCLDPMPGDFALPFPDLRLHDCRICV